MTTLNTIIEEEVTKHRCTCEDQPCHVVNITVDEFTSAMQRAYEAGQESDPLKGERRRVVEMIRVEEREKLRNIIEGKKRLTLSKGEEMSVDEEINQVLDDVLNKLK